MSFAESNAGRRVDPSNSHEASPVSAPLAAGGGGGTDAATTAAPAGGAASTAPETHSSLSTVALEALEQRYMEVLRALSAEPQLVLFRTEYEKLHRLLLSSHEGELRLLRQAHELREELDTHQQKVQAAMRLSQEDEEAIRVLRTEIETAWAKADAAHEQEQRSRELVNTLRQQVAELDASVEKTAGLSMGQEAYLRDLLAVKKDREEEAVTLHATMHRAEAEHQQATALLAAADKSFESSAQELEAQRRAYQQLLTNLEVEQRERAVKEANARQYREAIELCVRELEERGGMVDRAAREERRTGREAEAAMQEMQSLTRQLQEKQERFANEASRLAAAERQNTMLSNDIPQRQATLREHEEKLKRESKQLGRAERSARTQQADLTALVEKRATLATAVQKRSEAVEAAVTQLRREEKELRVVEEAAAKSMQHKSRIVAANTSQASARAQVEGKRVMEIGNRRRLEQQVEQLRTENESLRKAIYYAEQHRERDVKAAQSALLDYHRTLDAIRLRRNEAKLVEEDIANHQKKLKAQQELLSTVTVDRHRTEKTLRETEDELKQLQQRHATRQDELEGVKTDLIQQEAELCQLHGLARQLTKDVVNTEQRLRFLREDRQHAEGRVEALRSEALQLRQVISKCDLEGQQQAARLTVMTRERNTLAAQLLHRTEELDLLREKLQLADAARALGETQYGHMMDQLNGARDDLVEQRLRCRLALVRLRYLDRLNKRELGLEKTLTQSRARVRALADELSTKHNMHAWRSLEGNAPEILDGLAKVQLLQQKLIKKRDELQAKTTQVETAEQEYRRLHQQLARLPGPEAAEELALCSENMQQRRTQLVEMTHSLAQAEAEAEVLEGHVEQLNEELQRTKQRFYYERAKHDALRHGERMRAQAAGGRTATAASASPRQPRGLDAGASSRHGATTARADNSGAATTTRLASAPSSDDTDGFHQGPSGGSTPAASAGGESTQARAALSLGVGETRSLSQRSRGREGVVGGTPTAGPPQPVFPLQKPPNQRQFVGGGFSLTR